MDGEGHRGLKAANQVEHDEDIISTKQTMPRGGFRDQKDGRNGDEKLDGISGDTQISKEKETHQMNPRLANMIRLLFITYYGSLGALMPFVSK